MILDSDVLIEILRSNPRTARWVTAQASSGEALRYSPVSRAEIGAGMRAGEEMGIAALFAVELDCDRVLVLVHRFHDAANGAFLLGLGLISRLRGRVIREQLLRI